MKKNLLLVVFAFIIFGMRAQTVVEYQSPTGVLTEEAIAQILENSRKHGVKEWEIAIQSKGLHKRMQQQLTGDDNGSLQKGNTPPPQVNTSGCTNPGFENGTNSNWSMFSGSVSGATLPCNSCASTAGGSVNSIVNSTSSSALTPQYSGGQDYYGSFPVLAPAPSGGNFSMCLNDVSSGSKIERASYSFVVGSTNDLFTFQYAAVLNSGGHGPTEQPYFHVDVIDNNTGQAVSNCTDYDAVAPTSGSLTGWSISPHTAPDGTTVYYKLWTTVALDLSAPALVGHTVTVNFIVSDCIYGGHFGYCYIDADCGSPSSATNVTGFCGTTSGSITMTGPPGYTHYQWYGPSPNLTTPLAGDTSQILTINASVNDTFVVEGTFASGCISKFDVVVKPANINVTTSSSSTCKGGLGGSVSAIVGGAGSYNYSWTGPGGATIGTTNTINSLPAGTYSVHVTDAANQCPPKDTTVTILGINPTLQTSTSQLCGTQTILNAPTIFPNTIYTWYDNTNAVTSVTTQTYNLTNGNGSQHYTVTYLDSTHCEDSLKISLNQVNINFTPLTGNPCNGGNNGSLTFNASANNSFSTYDWAVTGGFTSGSTNVASPINISSLSQGTYSVLITAPSNTTCAYVYTVTLVDGATPTPKQDTIKICNMDVLTLNPGVPNSSHSWSGTNLPSSAGPYTSDPFSIQPPFSNTSPNYYQYTDTIYSNAGHCLSIYKALVILKSFKSTIAPVEKLKCFNDNNGKIKVSISEPTGPVNNPDKYIFTWSPGTYTSTSTGLPATSTESNLSAGTYTCVITNGTCVNTSTYVLTNPSPLPTDSFYAYYCPKDSLALLVANEGNTDYSWHEYGVAGTGGHVNQDSIQVPVTDINKIYVTYKHNGCVDTAKVIISVTTYNAFRPNETVNVFTPNNDKKNDVFFPFYQANLTQSQIAKQSQDYELKVYNRWGILMYETTDYNKGWDGKTKGGSDAEDGSYFFIVKYQSNCGTKADVVEKKGFIELLR